MVYLCNISMNTISYLKQLEYNRIYLWYIYIYIYTDNIIIPYTVYCIFHCRWRTINIYIYTYSIYWYQRPNLVNSIHLLVLGTWSSLESPVDSSISTRLYPCAQCSVKYLLVNVNLQFCQKTHRKPNGQIIPSVLSLNTREFTTAQPHNQWATPTASRYTLLLHKKWSDSHSWVTQ